jgi:hypothetical protein
MRGTAFRHPTPPLSSNNYIQTPQLRASLPQCGGPKHTGSSYSTFSFRAYISLEQPYILTLPGFDETAISPVFHRAPTQ